MKLQKILLTLATLSVLVPYGAANGLLPVSSVTNGDFEAHLPEAAGDLLADTPVDTCIGIGHQIWWGEDTILGDATNADVDSAAQRDPAEEATKYAGLGNCVYSANDGYDVVWLNAVTMAKREAVHWSHMPGDVKSVEFGDHDGDGDREARMPANRQLSGHNLWQAYPSAHQAFSANFQEFRFKVEDGAVPAGALVQISLSAEPLEVQNGELLLDIDCSLNIRGALLQPGADGWVRVDPVDAQLVAYKGTPDCAGIVEDFNSGNERDARYALGRTRVVQLSFWSFNTGSESVTIDDVAMYHPTTAAEEVLRGNVNA